MKRKLKTPKKPELSDTEALNRIHALMDGEEWDSDTTSAISAILAQTGREIHDSNETED